MIEVENIQRVVKYFITLEQMNDTNTLNLKNTYNVFRKSLYTEIIHDILFSFLMIL